MRAATLAAVILSIFALSAPAMARIEFCLVKPNGDVHLCYASIPSCEMNLQFFPGAFCMPVQR